MGAVVLSPGLWYESTYRLGLEEAEFSKDDWCNLLSISHRYECEGARKRSIKEISKLGSPVTDVDKITMAKKFEVEEWLVPACVGLVEREDPLTFAEADKLGLEMTVLVTKAREKYIQGQQQGNQSYSCVYGHPLAPPSPVLSTPTTTQLVKDILHIG